VSDPGAGAEPVAPIDDVAPTRLDNAEVRGRLAVLDEQLARLENTPGPISELALAAASGLAEIYGQALARVLDLAGPGQVERMLGDELIGHLLALHGIHPERVEARVARVINGLRAPLSTLGARLELVGIDDAVATVRVAVDRCGQGSAAIEQAVRGAILAGVPELTAVTTIKAARPASTAFVPVDSLMRAPMSAGPR
jgi:hypothetical protein